MHNKDKRKGGSAHSWAQTSKATHFQKNNSPHCSFSFYFFSYSIFFFFFSFLFHFSSFFDTEYQRRKQVKQSLSARCQCHSKAHNLMVEYKKKLLKRVQKY
jgi:hypothetical protein